MNTKRECKICGSNYFHKRENEKFNRSQYRHRLRKRHEATDKPEFFFTMLDGENVTVSRKLRRLLIKEAGFKRGDFIPVPVNKETEDSFFQQFASAVEKLVDTKKIAPETIFGLLKNTDFVTTANNFCKQMSIDLENLIQLIEKTKKQNGNSI